MNKPSKVLSICFLPLTLALAGVACDTPASNAPLFDDSAASQELAIEMASDHLFALDHDVDQFNVMQVSVDQMDMAHTRFQQMSGGVPVFGGEAIVHLRGDGSLRAVTDNILRGVDVDTTPLYVADEAIELALASWGDRTMLTEAPKVDLWVLRHKGTDHLAWRVQLKRLDGSAETAMPVIFVDAHTGRRIWSYDNLQTATGSTNYYGTVSFNAYTDGSSWYPEDQTRGLGTFTFNGGTSSLYYVSSSSSNFGSTNPSAVEAHYGAMQTYDYYQSAHGRNGLDGSGGPTYISTHGDSYLTSLVEYGTNYVNAYWSGDYMVYGDGNGTDSGPLTALDIAGHEMTHGVTEHTANLTYANESGAMNESMSDVFGAAVEAYTNGLSADVWAIGEAAWTPNTSGDALRYMDNPTADNSSKDHYSSRYTGSQDNGGVHWNSGIGNLAFYLVSAGGSHPRVSNGITVSGVGIDDAADIWYRALTRYMTSSTNFSGSRTATVQAAEDLYGACSAQVQAVEDAWAAVGVGSASTCGGGDTGGGDDTADTGGDTGGTGGGLACTNGTLYTGTLSGSGAQVQEPNGGSYTTSSRQDHVGTLSGPSSADFDLYLYKWNSRRGWQQVGASESGSSEESISYNGNRGTYTWLITSYSGSGTYELCLEI
ncbi:MAG: M4 family metallopeptidase [Alphaproteobacteria bacterium]|nr:M4 family metallopeptidase [Alphaproteobacteria bacterium]